MNYDDISQEKLLFIVGTTDKELFDAGFDIKRRYSEVPRAVMEKFGFIGYVLHGTGKPEILSRIEETFSSIYRTQDLAIGGHIGVFMYRDIFARVKVPLGYGRFLVEPFKLVDLTEIQLRIINSEPESQEIYIDQFADLMDIYYGSEDILNEFSKINLSLRYIGLSKLHLHGSAAILTGGYDYRGATQSSLLATELALKSGCAALGVSESDLKDPKKFGHNSVKLAEFIGESRPSFDADRVLRVLKRYPNYVINRYDAEQPQRRDVGNFVMGAQYIASEVIRQLSRRNLRKELKLQPNRRYPE